MLTGVIAGAVLSWLEEMCSLNRYLFNVEIEIYRFEMFIKI